MSLRTLPRLIRTVRHLRPSQLAWRMRYTLERRLPARPPKTTGPPPDPDKASAVARVPPFHRAGLDGRALVEDLQQGRFTHLHRSVEIGRREPDWHLGGRSSERLWVVTLHYHGWAYGLAREAARGSQEAAGLLEHYVGDWIDRCDLQATGARDLAWNCFAIATRLGWWARILAEPGLTLPGDLEPRMRASMARQAAWLHDHLEWDLQGNHLIRDLVGLAWAARSFGGQPARRWMDTAARVARQQLGEQVLDDGAHFELSPMYHVHVMEDVLTLALLLDDREAAGQCADAWMRMAGYLSWLRDPAGRIPLLNDGGWNGAMAADEMLALASAIGRDADAGPRRGGRLFERSGVAAWHADPWTLFFDLGPIGPAAVPGHGHADNLTFEAVWRGARLFVDPGSYSYDHDDRRRRDRSTAAHNTVEVDGLDSSEVWHIFRVGRRARPIDVRAEIDDERFEASGAHTGYRHLPGSPIHQRRLCADTSGRLVVEDRVDGRGRHRVSGGLLLDPEWSAAPDGDGWLLSRGTEQLRVSVTGAGALARSVEPAPYHPEYGQELSTTRLCWTVSAELPVDVRTEVGRP